MGSEYFEGVLKKLKSAKEQEKKDKEQREKHENEERQKYAREAMGLIKRQIRKEIWKYESSITEHLHTLGKVYWGEDATIIDVDDNSVEKNLSFAASSAYATGIAQYKWSVHKPIVRKGPRTETEKFGVTLNIVIDPFKDAPKEIYFTVVARDMPEQGNKIKTFEDLLFCLYQAFDQGPIDSYLPFEQ